jgi:hypothetical protein
LISYAALEIYSYDSNYGGLRAYVNDFPYYAWGGRYSENMGSVSLPQYGYDAALLNGFGSYCGTGIGAGRMTLDMFQSGGNPRYSSTGYPFWGFASVSTNSDGYYSSGALVPGEYLIYVTDNSTGRKITFNANIYCPWERLDFDLCQSCFGQSTCQVLQ